MRSFGVCDGEAWGDNGGSESGSELRAVGSESSKWERWSVEKDIEER